MTEAATTLTRADGLRGSNDARVSAIRSGLSAPSASTSAPSMVRADIEATRVQVQAQTRGAAGSFDAKSEILTKPDGTLESKKSLLLQTGKQIAADASGTSENAKDAVKSILKRER